VFLQHRDYQDLDSVALMGEALVPAVTSF
jgi:hypothetical protein